MIRRSLERGKMQPGSRWNAFVDLVAVEEPESLSPLQRTAQLAFWYDAEVQNGGHLQYFLNSAGRSAAEAVSALRTLGAAGPLEILSEALALWTSRSRTAPRTVEEFVDEALDGEFAELDTRYYACSPDLCSYLETYLDRYESEFIVYTDES